MIALFRPEIVEALADADRLVKPWLAEGDTWRKDADGLPELDDMMLALGRLRVREHPGVDLRVSYGPFEYVINECDSREEFSADTLPEAVLLMLADDLRRTCAECRQYDGHDTTCSTTAAEPAEAVVA